MLSHWGMVVVVGGGGALILSSCQNGLQRAGAGGWVGGCPAPSQFCKPRVLAPGARKTYLGTGWGGSEPLIDSPPPPSLGGTLTGHSGGVPPAPPPQFTRTAAPPARPCGRGGARAGPVLRAPGSPSTSKAPPPRAEGPGVGSATRAQLSTDQQAVWRLPEPCGLGQKGRGAASRSTKRSTHARPGMHMQQCSAVPLIRWFRKHLSVCTGCTDVCHVTLLSGRVLSAITSSLHVTILGFEVYRRLDRLAVRWLSIGQPVMSSHSTLREEVSGVCVC